MAKRKSKDKLSGMMINLPNSLIDNIDDLVSRTGASRAEVIKTLLDYCIRNRNIIDKAFPLGEEGGGEEAEEEKEREEAEKKGEEGVELEEREEEEEENEEGEETEENVSEWEDEEGL